jgi:hypothetical protein
MNRCIDPEELAKGGMAEIRRWSPAAAPLRIISPAIAVCSFHIGEYRHG